ncbi:copper amine oxidase N-terminal domain-containing protein [Paenibacillus sp. P96]|uniref:Copper amine oxidase N-terminal domain-containing protein n=1 Tax=Paenibacillus zeirhizosphaerae TaxID=2987519 RepID=A0ABT9FPW3_9BACL|nr:copper amine oxidase N-terminal domain-containing protein [Paenibacillus sp. P96]MDP4096767.1 copper amine oxidase N-terminal domain-containing protein [Paenibacillus sp. P96]
MNLKKWTMLTVLAVSQAAAVMPAAAAEAPVTEASELNDQLADTTNESTVEETTDVNDATEYVDDVTGSVDDSVEEENAPTSGDTDSTEDTQGDVSVTDDVYIPAAANQLILYMNSAKMVQDGQIYTATQPMTVKNGVSYVAIRSLVNRVGLQFYYDTATKETVITQGEQVLRFKTDSNVYTVNGEARQMKGPAFQQKNVFMVPLTSITQALNIPYTVDNVNKTVILDLVSKPVASFTTKPSVDIYATQSQVTYLTQSSSPRGLPIVNERWEGRQDVFQEPGNYTVTYSVQDSSGQWSDPYSLTITVKPQNQPPVALFTTDKKEYKMGEKITITDLSTDDENRIEKREWVNNKLAFFESGEKEISLTVTDKMGLTSTYTQTITITNETLYEEDDFNKLFTPYGELYNFDGGEVPQMETVPVSVTSGSRLLIRANSPERVFQDGIVYQEVGTGSQRILVHYVNETGRSVKMYVVATNNNIVPATVNVEASGFGGPSPFATAAGKAGTQRYLQSLVDGSQRATTLLNPGESKVILPELSAASMKPDQVISLLSDLNTDQPIQYTVIMVEESADPLLAMQTLPKLDKDGIHNRGTYMNADRTMEYTEEVGRKEQRIVIGDNNVDPNLTGTDGIDGSTASNAGNFGVLYKIRLSNVAPYSLITFNPRGGLYTGYAMVNNQIVGIANQGGVRAPNENSVLYRTGHMAESVEIYFTAAAGSNLPVNLLVTPLPEYKPNN